MANFLSSHLQESLISVKHLKFSIHSLNECAIFIFGKNLRRDGILVLMLGIPIAEYSKNLLGLAPRLKEFNR